MNTPALPTVPLTSPDFVRVPSYSTNIAITWRKALAAQQASKEKMRLQ